MAVGETIIFTYDVAWKESDTHWASRWDIYLTMNHAVKNRVRLRGFCVLFSCCWLREIRCCGDPVLRFNVEASSTRDPPLLPLQCFLSLARSRAPSWSCKPRVPYWARCLLGGLLETLTCLCDFFTLVCCLVIVLGTL